jgi:small basic protein (TIGR04137 family)
MSIDTSLRGKSALVRHKNVLTKAERIARLKELERWESVNRVLGMPKVSNRKIKAVAKKKKGDDAAASK